MTAPPADLAALRDGGKPALARALIALETDGDNPAVARLLDEAFADPRGIVLGLTGPPGVGKSTLLNALIAGIRARRESVGVVAVDPSSRRSGGALLGDRTRISTDPEDQGVFLRSMAARDRLGGLAALTYPAVVLMRALFDRVIVETVGIGQSESDISDVADLVAFCAQPGAGDALQYMKAGITELPDLVLVTKGDLGPLAERTRADLSGALGLAAAGGREVPVLIVSSQTGAGIAEMLDMLASRVPEPGTLRRRRNRQAVEWGVRCLIESFGREGAALLPPLDGVVERPFTTVAERVARLRAGLEKLRETL